MENRLHLSSVKSKIVHKLIFIIQITDLVKHIEFNQCTHYSLYRAAPHRTGTRSYQRSVWFCLLCSYQSGHHTWNCKIRERENQQAKWSMLKERKERQKVKERRYWSGLNTFSSSAVGNQCSHFLVMTTVECCIFIPGPQSSFTTSIISWAFTNIFRMHIKIRDFRVPFYFLTSNKGHQMKISLWV